MRTLSLLWRCGVAIGCAVNVALAAPLPHPTRRDRLVEEREGIRVEYSPGQEAYAEAVFGPLTAWRKEFAELEAERLAAGPAVVSGSARDLIVHRDEILIKVAAEIGLAAPTALQGRVFDAMAEHYEMISALAEAMPTAIAPYLGYCNEVQIWAKADLTRRLGAGESIPGFSYNPVSGEGEFKFEIEPIQVGDQQAEEQKFEAQRLDHSFNYRTGEDGVVDLAASFSVSKDGTPQPLRPSVRDHRWDAFGGEARRRVLALESRIVPIVLTEKHAGKSPAKVAAELVAGLHDMVASANGNGDYRNPFLAHTILHEVTEVGIVENYVGSADRRWLCDGVANYVAWKVLRDRCGAEFARESYDLDAQLVRYVGLQKQINLKRWRAVEATKEEERETLLNKAHYAFATRVIFELVRQHGEAALPTLFQEIARTPRAKVRISTVEKAYRKVTGKKLDDLIRAAENAPVAAAPK